jgi:maltodextrin utilization protein YvdJ
METKLTIARAALRFGLILGLSLIAFFIVLILLDTDSDSSLQYISWLITGGVLFYALTEVKRVNNSLSVKESFQIGTLASGIGGFLSGVVSMIYFTVAPEELDEIRTKAMESALESPNMTDEAAQIAEQWVNMMTSPAALLVFSVLGTMFIGFILSIVFGLILKKAAPETL